MRGKLIALSLGVGAAAGAVAIMMLPRQHAARRFARRAAVEVEDAFANTTHKICKTCHKIMN